MKYFSFFLFFLLFLNCKNPTTQESLQIIKKESKRIEISNKLVLNEETEAFIQPYRERITEEMNTKLSYTPKLLSKKDGKYNTPIGNMMADAVFEMANPIYKKRTGNTIDAVILNHGGIRAEINPGDITTKTAYEIMPFENEIVVVKLQAEQIQAMFDYLAQAKRAHPISNMQLVLSEDFKILAQSIAGKPVDKDSVYHIATSDYLQNGGDHMLFLTQPEKLTVLDYKLRNLLIDYFKKHPEINPEKDQRFIER
ncbi:5'-nucleotidase C-terminal domain-containing protein [Mesonia sp. K7]|uniref:5'-nucleotidase C-terminal domain-containing protein n=1 Tax=Mesonia sp. K7 TaxID=2218606 RepID=UPI000DA9AA8C|nr:5'-nucleotidase [Mesonia sp. K7]PZD79571.1 hypothetical protein DNG35_00765 [Mesonia sp. K7]